MFSLPPVTQALIVANIAVFILDSLVGRAISLTFALWPIGPRFEPWQILSYAFLHGGISHLLFNMYGLFLFGGDVERVWGTRRYLTFYLFCAVFAGGVQLIVSTGSGAYYPTVGASGALFGLFAAMLVVYRRIGEDIRSMLVWMAVNFLMPFLVGGIAWQAHVGGFIVGGVFTWLLISGVHALRGKSLTFRTMVYGAVVLALIVAGVLVCNLSNPALTYIM